VAVASGDVGEEMCDLSGVAHVRVGWDVGDSGGDGRPGSGAIRRAVADIDAAGGGRDGGGFGEEGVIRGARRKDRRADRAGGRVKGVGWGGMGWPGGLLVGRRWW